VALHQKRRKANGDEMMIRSIDIGSVSSGESSDPPLLSLASMVSIPRCESFSSILFTKELPEDKTELQRLVIHLK
jgi:hypothetical protein